MADWLTLTTPNNTQVSNSNADKYQLSRDTRSQPQKLHRASDILLHDDQFFTSQGIHYEHMGYVSTTTQTFLLNLRYDILNLNAQSWFSHTTFHQSSYTNIPYVPFHLNATMDSILYFINYFVLSKAVTTRDIEDVCTYIDNMYYNHSLDAVNCVKQFYVAVTNRTWTYFSIKLGIEIIDYLENLVTLNFVI